MAETFKSTEITEALILSIIKNNTTFKSKKKTRELLKVIKEVEKGLISFAYACKMMAKGNLEEYLETGETTYLSRAEVFKYWSIRMGSDEWDLKLN